MNEEDKIDNWKNIIIDYLINDYELLSYNDVIDNIKYNCWFIAGYDWHSIFNYLSEEAKIFIRDNIYTNVEYTDETHYMDYNWNYFSENMDWDNYINDVMNIKKKYKFEMTINGIDYYSHNPTTKFSKN